MKLKDIEPETMLEVLNSANAKKRFNVSICEYPRYLRFNDF